MKKFLLFWAPSILFLSCFDFSNMYFRTFHYVFQARDMARAALLLGGHPIFFGPEMTGGGNLPGPFYYVLLALPLLFGTSWVLAWSLMVGLTAFGANLGWRFMSQRFSAVEAVVWTILFASSIHVIRLLQVFLNVSFIYPFAIASFIAFFIALTAEKSARRRRAYFVGSLVTGFAIQLHFSSGIFLAGFLLAQPLSQFLEVHRMKIKDICLGLLIFILPLLPYFIFLLSGRTLGQRLFFAGEATGAFPSLIAVAETGFQLPSSRLWMSLFTKLLESLPWMLFPLFLAVLIVPSPKKGQDEFAPWLKPLAFFALLTLFPFLYWTIATIGVRYAAHFCLLTVFLAAMLFSSLTLRPRRLLVYAIGASLCGVAALSFYFLVTPYPPLVKDYLRLGAFVLGGPFLLWLSESLDLKKNQILYLAIAATGLLGFAQKELGRIGYLSTEVRIMPTVWQWTQIWRHIYGRTGWSYEEAMRRVYFVSHHLEQDGRMTYEAVVRDLKPDIAAPPPDGFFVSSNKLIENFDGDTRKWLLSENIPEEIKEAIAKDEIEFGLPIGREFVLVPYKVHRTDHVPRFFHANGEGYFASPDDLILQEASGAEGVKALNDGRLMFKWNECPSQDPFCNTGAIVSVDSSRPENKKISVQIVGSTLSQISPWISPTWTQRWVKPYMVVECGGKDFRFEIASGIGFSRRYVGLPTHVLLWGNNSILAPFFKEFEFPCSKNVGEITIGREGSEVEMIHKVEVLPARKLSLHL